MLGDEALAPGGQSNGGRPGTGATQNVVGASVGKRPQQLSEWTGLGQNVVHQTRQG